MQMWKVSVIIPCWEFCEFLLDTVASVETCGELIDQVICVDDDRQDPAIEDIFNYLLNQGYLILRNSQIETLEQALVWGIEQVKTPYFLPLLPTDKIYPDALKMAVDILDKSQEFAGVYGNIQWLIDGEQVSSLNLDNYHNLRENYLPVSTLWRTTAWQQFILGSNSDNLLWGNRWLKRSQDELLFYHVSQTLSIFPVWPGENLSEFYHLINNDSEKEPVFESISLTLNSSSPLVSVCIPTYNGSEFLAEAITSILSQTYPHLEIIISDDQSQDQTLEIAQFFANHSSLPFKIFSHEQYGLGNNCNFCAQHSQGNYLKFLFQDDILHPHCIEKMVNLAQQEPEIGLVFSPRNIMVPATFDQDPSLVAIYHSIAQVQQYWSNLQPIQPGHQLFLDPAIFHYPLNKIGEPSNVLLSRSIFEQVGGFDPNLNQLIDLDLWWRIMANSKIGFINETLSYFRIHSQQQTYRNVKAGVAGDVNFYQKISRQSIYNFLPEKFRQQALVIYVILLNENYLKKRDLEITLSQLHQIRYEIAETLLKSSLEQLQNLYQNDLGTLHRLFLRNGFSQENLLQFEEKLCQNCRQIFKENPQDPRPILAQLLYYPLPELPPLPNLDPLPSWLSKDWQKWQKVQRYYSIL